MNPPGFVPALHCRASLLSPETLLGLVSAGLGRKVTAPAQIPVGAWKAGAGRRVVTLEVPRPSGAAAQDDGL
jgi:hypothetical protein